MMVQLIGIDLANSGLYSGHAIGAAYRALYDTMASHATSTTRR